MAGQMGFFGLLVKFFAHGQKKEIVQREKEHKAIVQQIIAEHRKAQEGA